MHRKLNDSYVACYLRVAILVSVEVVLRDSVYFGMQ